jgi:hypothetical protein
MSPWSVYPNQETAQSVLAKAREAAQSSLGKTASSSRTCNSSLQDMSASFQDAIATAEGASACA